MSDVDLAAFGIVIDDIAPEGGPAAAGVLGGGGPQAAFGMRLWAERVGLVARVGADLPAAAWDWLRAAGLDLRGMQVTAQPTLRARERVTADGRRHHEWLVANEVVNAQLGLALRDVPSAYHGARGWHLGLHPEAPNFDLLRGLRSLGGVLSAETFRPAAVPLAPEALHALLRAVDVFSPNRRGARSLVGPGEPLGLARKLLEAGARVLALRLGVEGSLACALRAGATHAVVIPAVPVAVVNVVGAGNAYCGGFLAGWIDTGDVLEAGLRGAVAASFLLEQVGVPLPSAALRQEAERRLAALRPRAQVIAL